MTHILNMQHIHTTEIRIRLVSWRTLLMCVDTTPVPLAETNKMLDFFMLYDIFAVLFFHEVLLFVAQAMDVVDCCRLTLCVSCMTRKPQAVPLKSATHKIKLKLIENEMSETKTK